jgi:hypothetical protein
MFAVGLHDQLLLCDTAGWLISLQRHKAGGGHSIAWSPDGMTAAVACGSGAIMIASVLDLDVQSGSSQVRCRGSSTSYTVF